MKKDILSKDAIFYTGRYNGNPLKVHKHIHEMFPLTSAHFYR